MAEKHRPALIPVPVPPVGISMNPASSANLFRSYPMSYPSAQASFERGSLGSSGGNMSAAPIAATAPADQASSNAAAALVAAGSHRVAHARTLPAPTATTASIAQQTMYDPVRASSGSTTFVPAFEPVPMTEDGVAAQAEVPMNAAKAVVAMQQDSNRAEESSGGLQAQQGATLETNHGGSASPNYQHSNNQFLPHYDQGVSSPQDEVMSGMRADGSALPRTHVCEHCNARFTRLHNLKSHLLTHTSSKKEFTCSDCGSEFRRLHDLKRHQKLHTGEKPFACDMCGRRFARADALGRHTKSASTEGNCANTPRKSKSEPGSLHSTHAVLHDVDLQAMVAAGGSHSTPNPLRSLTQIDTSFGPREEFLAQQADSSDGSNLQHGSHTEEHPLTTTTGRSGPTFNNDHILEAQLVASPGDLSSRDDWAMRYEQLLQDHQALQRQFTEMSERLKFVEARHEAMQ